jgi:hypothetical protein
MPQGWPLLGRETELAHLAEAIAGGQAGVVLAGAAGMGKTRLAREAIGRAEEQGAATAWVVATRAGASIPFGPFASLLPATPGPSTSPLDLLRHFGDTLVGRVPGRRLVVGVDDAHVLDDASAALVHQLALSDGVFVLVNVRTGENLPDPILALWKDELAERLELRGLSGEQFGELVPRVLGGQVDGPTVAKLWEMTRGNLLFLRELILTGLDSAALREAGGVWSWRGSTAVSPRLQEVVATRLGTLEPEQAALLEVLALSEPAPASFLEAMFSSTTLEAAERSGMAVVEKEGRRVVVRLAHPLYGEVAAARCPVLRARAIHRQLATALEATGARRHEDLLPLLIGRLESGESPPAQLLVEGGRRAIFSFEFALAERFAWAWA